MKLTPYANSVLTAALNGEQIQARDTPSATWENYEEPAQKALIARMLKDDNGTKDLKSYYRVAPKVHAGTFKREDFPAALGPIGKDWPNVKEIHLSYSETDKEWKVIWSEGPL